MCLDYLIVTGIQDASCIMSCSIIILEHVFCTLIGKCDKIIHDLLHTYLLGIQSERLSVRRGCSKEEVVV